MIPAARKTAVGSIQQEIGKFIIDVEKIPIIAARQNQNKGILVLLTRS